MRAVALPILLISFITLMAPAVLAQVDSANTRTHGNITPLQDTLFKPTPLSLINQQSTHPLFDASLDSLLRQDPELRSAMLRYVFLASVQDSRTVLANQELNRRLRAVTHFSQFEVMGLVAKRKQENARKPPIHGQLGQLSITGLIELIEELIK